MRIHENGGTTWHRSESTCGYCRQKGHNQYQCSKVKSDWASWRDYKIPLDENGNVSRSGWYGAYPDTWGQWYEHCRKTYNTIIEREETLKSNGTTTPRKSSPRSCGFCGSKEHTRRNCTTMDMFLKDCHEANIKWRTAVYKEVVQENGISVGAAVVINKTSWHAPAEKISGIITSINWETLNVFTALENKHDDVHSPIEVKVLLSTGDVVVVNDGFQAFKCFGLRGWKPYRYGQNTAIAKVVAPAKAPLGPEWIKGYKDAFKTLTRKRNLDQLKNGMPSSYSSEDLVRHINTWK